MSDAVRATAGMLPDWPRVLGQPPYGYFKLAPEDFSVTEVLGFEPEKHGPHLWCWLEKQGVDTLQAIASLSRITGIPQREIGYSGLKDRQAITFQWISLPLEILGQQGLTAEQTEALQQAGVYLSRTLRHPRKLKRGSHRANRFALTIMFDSKDRDAILQRWNQLLVSGVPNYFGAQRFGFHGQNIARARALLARGWSKKQDRNGLMLSTARSYLFNRTLAQRVNAANWNQALSGEVLNLNGSGSFFLSSKATPEEISQRVADFDLHPTAPLWGLGRLESELDARDTEQRSVSDESELITGLERARVQMARRALRIVLEDAEWKDIPSAEVRSSAGTVASGVEENSIGTPAGVQLVFTLPRGAYATAVLRELITAEGL